MSQIIQFRRGTDEERTGIIFRLGEPIWVVDTNTLYVGNGIVSGGLPMNGIPSNNDFLVHTTGNETVTGLKTFNGGIILKHSNGAPLLSGNKIYYDTLSTKNRLLDLDSGVFWTTEGRASCNMDLRRLYSNTSVVTLDWRNSVLSGFWQVVTSTPPTSSTSFGFKGQLATSGSYLFVCTGDSLWGRTTLSSF